MAAVVALAACAGPAPLSEGDRRREQSAQAHQRASAALARGEYGTAQQQYEQALDRGRAVEDQDATAIGLLNVAAVLHRGGDFAAARAKLLAVIEREPPLGPGYVGRAEARLALIELQTDRVAEAARHAARAGELCPPADCPWRLALLNVEAGIALQSGDLATAESRARATLAAAARAGEPGEEANARRLLGEVAERGGRGADAREAFLAALALDRKMETPERIALDLLSLARLELGLGNRDAGRAYARRAADVAEGAKLAAVLGTARALLREAK